MKLGLLGIAKEYSRNFVVHICHAIIHKKLDRQSSEIKKIAFKRMSNLKFFSISY